jgi:hypothetical protein
MLESQSQIATNILIPLSVSFSLPFFASQQENTIPSRFYDIPATELADETWQTFNSSCLQNALSDRAKYQTIHDFASKLLQESNDIPPEFAKIIDEEFWNLV